MTPSRPKIGIITMHRVHNFGSALQAYATQRALEKLGFSSQTIDYIYPNHTHLSRKKQQPVQYFLACIRDFFLVNTNYFLDIITKRNRSKKLFELFFRNHLSMSSIKYNSPEEIHACPPQFDLYLTGSDQVWNPKHMKGDSTFMCSFAPADKPRISYASSFATRVIDPELQTTYRKWLSKFSHISVRENSGRSLATALSGKKAKLVCDPTMLLTKEEWMPLIKESIINIPEKFILAYILKYAFNPYPQIDTMVKQLQEQTGMKVIRIHANPKHLLDQKTKLLFGIGPNEFLWLFQNAEFVITNSFHGTVFSLLFEKPFYSVVHSLNGNDSRMTDLLNQVGAIDRAIPLTTPKIEYRQIDYTDICGKVADFRQQSFNYLQEAVHSHFNKSLL